MPETPAHYQEEGFVAPTTEQELEAINRQNMTTEQSIASHSRERSMNAYGKEMPSMEYTATRDGHQNNGILRGKVRGIDLELRRKHVGYEGQNNVGGASGDIYAYSGTMNGQPLKSEDAEKLFMRYGSAPTAERLDQLTQQAAESIKPKEVMPDIYSQTLDTLLEESK